MFDVWEERFFRSLVTMISKTDEDDKIYRVWFKDIRKNLNDRSIQASDIKKCVKLSKRLSALDKNEIRKTFNELACARLSVSLKRLPTLVDLKEIGVTRAQIRCSHDNLTNLTERSIQNYPKYYEFIV